jgi:hypothetical protein
VQGQGCKNRFSSTIRLSLSPYAHSQKEIVKHNLSPFKWRHFEPTIILLCGRWYCSYQLSYRDLEEMMRKGQVKRLSGSEAIAQAKFVASLFQIAA